jgi:hypothetical protein
MKAIIGENIAAKGNIGAALVDLVRTMHGISRLETQKPWASTIDGA